MQQLRPKCEHGKSPANCDKKDGGLWCHKQGECIDFLDYKKRYADYQKKSAEWNEAENEKCRKAHPYQYQRQSFSELEPWYTRCHNGCHSKDCVKLCSHGKVNVECISCYIGTQYIGYNCIVSRAYGSGFNSGRGYGSMQYASSSTIQKNIHKLTKKQIFGIEEWSNKFSFNCIDHLFGYPNKVCKHAKMLSSCTECYSNRLKCEHSDIKCSICGIDEAYMLYGVRLILLS